MSIDNERSIEAIADEESAEAIAKQLPDGEEGCEPVEQGAEAIAKQLPDGEEGCEPVEQNAEAIAKQPERRIDTPILLMCAPLIIFPVLYFPYSLWWRKGFAELVRSLASGVDSNLLRIMITSNNTILLFWCAVTAIVMLCAIVISIFRVRPWYIIPLYLAVIFSLCGICSLFFYTLIIS